MRYTLPLFIVALFFFAPCRAEDTSVPDIVTRGFEAYQKDGMHAGIDTWLKGSPLESDKSVRSLAIQRGSQVEADYGKFTGWEIIRVVAISSSTRRVYAVAKFEKAPLWLVFDCYKPAADWIIPVVDFNVRASLILPPNILGGP